jgi:hypothetical protein
MDAVSGRYSMPAVWGADIGIAVLLSALVTANTTFWKRTAYVALACGLVGVAVACLGKQDKFRARADLLWQVLEYAERQAPSGMCVGWMDGSALNQEEGIHFYWHLVGRGRQCLNVRLLDTDGKLIPRRELPGETPEPGWLVSGTSGAPQAGNWQLVREFATPYWGQTRDQKCYLWSRQHDHTDQLEETARVSVSR